MGNSADPAAARRPPWPGRVIKRAFDLIAGTALLTAATPLLLVLMAALLLAGGRPVLFRQARVTRSGRVTEIMKLRTTTGQDPDTQWTVPPDQCSRLGWWLRATHLDELPQLVNVIRGDMSLIGPRPERPHFASQFAREIPHYEDRHRIRSGMTGWAQVHGLTGDTSIAERAPFRQPLHRALVTVAGSGHPGPHNGPAAGRREKRTPPRPRA
jgi:lipopolysaccharide/colanic/teichoic acid biosynthesis glycosyltransferase